MNETIKVLHHRASIRKYDDMPISSTHQDLINEAIFRSPTAGNMQDFSVIIVDEPELKAQLSTLCDHQLFIKEAPLLYIFVADFTRYDKYFKLCNVDQSEFKAPHLGSMMNAIIDSTIAAQSASVAANSLGIGTCYIGDIVENYEAVTKLLNINPNTIPVTMLTMGYYTQELKLSPKIDKSFIFHKNIYKEPTDKQILEMFELKKVPKKFQDQFDNFGQFYYKHKVGASFSVEMDRSMRKYISNFNHNEKK